MERSTRSSFERGEERVDRPTKKEGNHSLDSNLFENKLQVFFFINSYTYTVYST